MTLQDILAVNGWSRSRFDTLKGRTGLPFMALQLDERRGRNKYAFAHAVAIGVMDDFLKLGVDAKRAAQVISEVFPHLYAVAQSHSDDGATIDENDVLPNWVFYVDQGPGGWSFSAGEQPDTSLEALAEVRGLEARYRVDIYAVMRRLNAVSFLDVRAV